MTSAHSEPVRDPKTVRRALAKACAAAPDQRVMQVIVNACGNDPFYVEDWEAVQLLNDYARENK